VSLSAPALTLCISTTFIEYRCQLNSIFSAKTDPRENPEKNPAEMKHAATMNNI
jgi:hypothetical protein